MMLKRPNPHLGLRHIALYVQNLTKCVDFYTRLLGFALIWQPDNDNYYLSSGTDNLALHRAGSVIPANTPSTLDHIGLFLATPEDVDAWHEFLVAHHVSIKYPPKSHRDGARSFYCTDPDGTLIQMIYYPCN